MIDHDANNLIAGLIAVALCILAVALEAALTAPCEHGDPDWETCPQCLAAWNTRTQEQQT